MTFEMEEVISACRIIATQENVDICITSAAQGAAVAGAGAFVCGLFLGPPGLAIGGALGGLAGSAMSRSYKPLPQILSEMSQADRRKLYNHMKTALERLEVTDAIVLMAIVSNPQHALRETVAREFLAYFGNAVVPRQVA